jgi:hypothetical protein
MSGLSVLVFQVRSEADRPSATTLRALDHLSNRLHDVRDYGIVNFNPLREVFHQRHHLRADYRCAP